MSSSDERRQEQEKSQSLKKDPHHLEFKDFKEFLAEEENRLKRAEYELRQVLDQFGRCAETEEKMAFLARGFGKLEEAVLDFPSPPKRHPLHEIIESFLERKYLDYWRKAKYYSRW